MKKCILFALLLLTTLVFSQNKILFEYDKSGNQVSRTLCINCLQAGKSAATTTETALLETGDLQKFFPEDVISYYPNPVKEELYLKWELINENKVSEIQLFTLNGQLLTTISKLKTTNTQTIPFTNYPSGTYLLLLIYTNGDQKTIKIIKE